MSLHYPFSFLGEIPLRQIESHVCLSVSVSTVSSLSASAPSVLWIVKFVFFFFRLKFLILVCGLAAAKGEVAANAVINRNNTTTEDFIDGEDGSSALETFGTESPEKLGMMNEKLFFLCDYMK